MKTSDFYYELPTELIAQHPADPRDSARLLVYDRKTGKTEHRIFKEITEYLGKNDVLVMNNTRVIPARIYGTGKLTGCRVEFLLHKRLDMTDWKVLCKPARKAREHDIFDFGEGLTCEVLASGEMGETKETNAAPDMNPVANREGSGKEEWERKGIGRRLLRKRRKEEGRGG